MKNKMAINTYLSTTEKLINTQNRNRLRHRENILTVAEWRGVLVGWAKLVKGLNKFVVTE